MDKTTAMIYWLEIQESLEAKAAELGEYSKEHGCFITLPGNKPEFFAYQKLKDEQLTDFCNKHGLSQARLVEDAARLEMPAVNGDLDGYRRGLAELKKKLKEEDHGGDSTRAPDAQDQG